MTDTNHTQVHGCDSPQSACGCGNGPSREDIVTPSHTDGARSVSRHGRPPREGEPPSCTPRERVPAVGPADPPRIDTLRRRWREAMSRDGSGGDGGPRLCRYMKALLSMPVLDDEARQRLIGLGVRKKDINYALHICAALLDKVAQKGDVSAFKEILSIVQADDEDDTGQLWQILLSLKGEQAPTHSFSRGEGKQALVHDAG